MFVSLLTLGLLGLAAVGLICAGSSLFWVFELATHFSFYWFLCALLLTIGFLVMRRWWRGLSAAVLALFFGWGVVPYFSIAPDMGTGGKSGVRKLKVVLFNLLHMNTQFESAEAFLHSCDADLVVLQEFEPRWRTALQAFSSAYPHRELQVRRGAFGSAVLSRFPMSDVTWHPAAGADSPFVSATLDVAGEPLRIVAVHPIPPTGKGRARKRNDDLNAVSYLATGNGACLVIGDLNCSPWSPYFRRLCRDAGLRDSGLGRGLRSTWYPSSLPIGIPIDHILVSEHIGIASREVGPYLGSDHRPLVVELSF